MRRFTTLSVLALLACTDDPSTGDVDTDVDAGVLRDCAPTPGNICPYAGNGASGWNGDGHDKLDTSFSFPMSITLAVGKTPVIADWNNHKIRVIEADGTLTTIMGTSFFGDGDPDLADLTPAGAQGTDVNLNHPTQQAWLADGTLLSASWHTHKLRSWDPATGLVHVVLGKGGGFNEPAPDAEHPNGTAYPASQCLLNQPSMVVPDSAGDVWIVDMRNERIRRWDREADLVNTEIGTGVKDVIGAADCNSSLALETCMNLPKGGNPEPGGAIAFDGDESHLFLADSLSHVIRVWDRETDTVTVLAGAPGEAGDVDGVGGDARFDYPVGLAFEAETNTLFVADANNHKVRAIDTITGAVETFAGTGEPSCAVSYVEKPEVCPEQSRAGDGGPALDATLYRPFGVSLDADGNLVVVDTFNQRFRIVYR